MSSRTRQQLESYLATLQVRADRILDVGGSQKPIKSRLGFCYAKQIDILDIEHPHETKQKPDVVADIGDMFLRDAMEAAEGTYDVVFCMEVMEYIFDPMTAMNNLAFFLRKGGTLYISFPFIYPVHNPKEQDFLRYTEFGARKLCEMAGLRVDNVFYRTADATGIGAFFRWEGMKYSKEYDHHDAVGFIFRCTKK